MGAGDSMLEGIREKAGLSSVATRGAGWPGIEQQGGSNRAGVVSTGWALGCGDGRTESRIRCSLMP